MTTAAAPAPSVHVPLSERINFRMVAFGAVLLLLLGYPIYRLLDEQLHGGVWQRGEFTEINLKRLSDFPMDQFKATEDAIPEKWRQMDGKKVLLVGEMVIGQSMVGFDSDFDLVWSIQKCCLSGEPQVQHFIKCKVQPGKRVEYSPGLVEVKGTLHVGITRDPVTGRISSVYRVDVDGVEPK
jgi:hypothetical protein